MLFELGVPEQDLDDADVGAVLQQVGGEAVTQRVRPDPLGDVGGLRRLDDDAIELPRADRLHRVLPREQPAVAMHHALLPPDLPPLRAAARAGPARAWRCGTRPPLPRSTRSSMRSLSTSATFSIATSATRRPAP